MLFVEFFVGMRLVGRKDPAQKILFSADNLCFLISHYTSVCIGAHDKGGAGNK